MKALVVNALGRGFELEDIDIAPQRGEKFWSTSKLPGSVTPTYCSRLTTSFPTPAVLGHELSGIVADIGPDVAQFRVGAHVVGSLSQSCGSCARCLSGRPFQCQHPELTLLRPSDAPRLNRHGTALFQGLGLGGFAEQALVHENQLAPLPKEMLFAQAALLAAGSSPAQEPS